MTVGKANNEGDSRTHTLMPLCSSNIKKPFKSQSISDGILSLARTACKFRISTVPPLFGTRVLKPIEPPLPLRGGEYAAVPDKVFGNSSSALSRHLYHPPP